MRRDIIIGVDVGGTKIMAGAIMKSGQIIGEPIKIPTGGKDEPEKIIGRIQDSIERTIQNSGYSQANVRGIGLGITGPLDIEKGIILECPQLPTLHFFPLRKVFEERYGIPVYMNNDANCLIYGEAMFGAGRGKNNIVGFTLGTGLGCAIIINKKIFNGSSGTAAEMWISPYLDSIIEDYVCGAGVTKIFESISGQRKSALAVTLLAQQGDTNALKTWKEYGKHLGIAISWAINIIDPEIIILGGSIANAFDFFFPELESFVQQNICAIPFRKIEIVQACLKDYAGFIGAACLVINPKSSFR